MDQVPSDMMHPRLAANHIRALDVLDFQIFLAIFADRTGVLLPEMPIHGTFIESCSTNFIIHKASLKRKFMLPIILCINFCHSKFI